RRRGAEDRAPQLVLAPYELRQQLADRVVGIVLVREDLLADDGLFALDLLRSELRATYDVAEYVERLREMLGERACIHAHLLARGERIEMATERLEALRDRTRVAALGALEQHVLEKVRDAETFLGLVARTASHPYADRHRESLPHRLGDHHHAGWQN